MTATTFDTAITADGEYSFTQLPPGSLAVIDIYGTFGSGTVTLGAVNYAGTFTAIKDATRTNITATAADLFEVRVPPTGKLAISISGSTTPSIKLAACIASN